jgi:hypothetical protein
MRFAGNTRRTAVKLRACVAVALAVLVGRPVGLLAQEPISCGPYAEKHEIIKHKGSYPVPAPSRGKAMIIIGLGKSFTKSYQQKLAVNGTWRAVLKESQYSFFEVDPGIVRLCWGGRLERRDDNYLLITAQPDQTYYIRGTLRSIVELDPAEGRKFIEKKTYVTYEVRP